MEIKEYFQLWMNVVFEEQHLESLLHFQYISFAGLLFLFLKAKIGVTRALIFAPASVLVEKTCYTTMRLAAQSCFSTVMFLAVTGMLISWLLYYIFIRDDASCSEI